MITDIIMRHHIARCKVDPVLAPDQFSVARPLRPEDLDRRVTRQGVILQYLPRMVFPGVNM